MANISGLPGYVQPSVYSRVRTLRRSISVPGGSKTLAIIGLGERQETVILSAEGGGDDGENPDFTGSDTPDGRHFQLAKTDLVLNRTIILKNDIPLNGVEDVIDTAAFDSSYDYRIESDNGRIELQKAHLVSQGQNYYLAGTSNVGNGSFSTLNLIDANAPSETWTFRCTSTVNDAYGDPISGLATFTATGSVSGQPVDAYGAPIYFVSDGVLRDNGILQVAMTEGATVFERGDRFTVLVSSGVLIEGDKLEAKYIATEDLNDPELFTDANALYAKHGFPSETNTLSLGASMAFENGAWGVLAVQAKPPTPRRTSEVIVERDDPLTDDYEGFTAVGSPITSADEDAFNYSINGVPDTNTEVHTFVIDRSTGEETQVFPTKVTFYDATITADPYNNFIDSANYTYSYTVILDSQVEDHGDDGEISVGGHTFTADSAAFLAFNLDVGENASNKAIRILKRDKYGIAVVGDSGTYTISSVTNATTVVLTGATWVGTHTDLMWELIDTSDTSARVLYTTDLHTSGTIRRRDGIRVTYIDTDDADFFDTNWAAALESLEAFDCQMVVPLPDSTYSAIQQATVAHCNLMSNTANQKERIALIGAPRGVTSDSLLGLELVAAEDVGVIEGIQGDDVEEVLADNIEDLQNYDCGDNWGTFMRCVYFWPDEIVRSINGTNTYLHGFYQAAAAGGWFSGTPNDAIPLTRKILTGFSILRAKVRKPSILNMLGDNGVTVLQPVVGGGQVLHGRTTIQGGDATEEEPSVVFIRDRTARTLRAVLAGFIGQAEDPTLIASISAATGKTLQALTAQGLLTSYRNLSVVRDSVDSRQYNVSVEVQPAMPVNWIFIDVSVSIF